MTKKFTITFAASAVSDIEQILAWYAEQQEPDAGKRLISEVIERVGELERYPDMGRVVPEFDRANLRELIHPPFRIVYRRDLQTVRIVRIWRSERLLTVDK